jgi:hypothetical protein
MNEHLVTLAGTHGLGGRAPGSCLSEVIVAAAQGYSLDAIDRGFHFLVLDSFYFGGVIQRGCQYHGKRVLWDLDAF